MNWRDDAACWGLPNWLFFDAFEAGGTSAMAARRRVEPICQECPVRHECLEDALDTEFSGARYGYRGGMTPNQRELAARGRHARGRRAS